MFQNIIEVYTKKENIYKTEWLAKEIVSKHHKGLYKKRKHVLQVKSLYQPNEKLQDFGLMRFTNKHKVSVVGLILKTLIPPALWAWVV